jgi:hypothetical protein
MQLTQRRRKAFKIRAFSTHHAVRVFGLPLGPISSCSDSSNQQILDLVTIEYLNEAR